MFRHAIVAPVSPLYLMFGPAYRGEEARLALALHHQVLALQGQVASGLRW